MPRANRHFLPGHIWHITHRCHKKEFLLKFTKDRQRWLHWLFEAKKRYGLCVLNYVVTSNHIHLLVKDTKELVIPESIQLIAGRTGQEYNKRKARRGAYWEDRYHATAVDADTHFLKCLIYIDMNMIRAGVVKHPDEWIHGGYREIQSPPKRYRIIDLDALMQLLHVASLPELQHRYRQWLEEALQLNRPGREERWTQSIAVGSASYIERVKKSLGKKGDVKKVIEHEDGYSIREGRISYRPHFDIKMSRLRAKNTIPWDIM